MTPTKFKPMLADSVELDKLKYPLLASFKYDGIRATMQNGILMSRSLKPIPNKFVQQKFKDLPEGIDGELIAGDPNTHNVMQATSSAVMGRSNDDSNSVTFFIFDWYDPTMPFIERLHKAVALMQNYRGIGWYVVPQTKIHNEAELLDFEQQALNLGYEGVMVRSIDGLYKQGRATVKQGYLLKLKRFIDAEAEIIDCYEAMENTNEAKTNALGRTERSTAKAGMVGKGTLGGFNVIGVNGEWNGVEFGTGSGLNEIDGDPLNRHDLWKKRKNLPGKIIKYKYFPVGTKDAPRLPILLGFRDKVDM